MTREDWRDDAACSGYNPELWFPRGGKFDNSSRVVQVCQHCPVRAECLDDALKNDIRYGVWGGLTARQRRKLLDRRLVLAEGAVRRLQALARVGWTVTAVKAVVDRTPGATVSIPGLRDIRNGRVKSVHPETAAMVALVYAELITRRPTPSRYGQAARSHAIRAGWPAPEDWIGVDIDDPNAWPLRAAA